MRHDWKIGTTIDKCNNCGILRRTIAVRLSNGMLAPHPAHEYFVGGKWLRPKEISHSTRTCNPIKK